MSSNDHVRIEVGFDGGQIMSALVTGATADELEQALAAQREESMTLDTEDGRYSVALGRVVYLKRFAREGRLGFGNV